MWHGWLASERSPYERPETLTTDGSWGQLSLQGDECCPQGAQPGDILRYSVTVRRRSMLKRWLSVEPKGAARLKGAIIFVARVNKQGEQRDAKPCPRCMLQLARMGVVKVWWSTSEGYWRMEYIGI